MGIVNQSILVFLSQENSIFLVSLEHRIYKKQAIKTVTEQYSVRSKKEQTLT